MEQKRNSSVPKKLISWKGKKIYVFTLVIHNHKPFLNLIYNLSSHYVNDLRKILKRKLLIYGSSRLVSVPGNWQSECKSYFEMC